MKKEGREGREEGEKKLGRKGRRKEEGKGRERRRRGGINLDQSWRIQRIIAEKGRQRELEAAVHIVSAVRENGVLAAGTQLASPLICSSGLKPKG